jgi:voltage-gated potassium channel
LAGFVAAGTVAYSLVEGWSLAESLYMVVITLSTVGYGEVRPLSGAGRAVTITLIVGGLAGAAYAAGVFSRIVIGGELLEVLGRRRMNRDIARTSGHIIVCGYGRVGRNVCLDLRDEGVEVVVIEKDEDSIARADSEGVLVVRGDATDEQHMRAAGIDRCSGLILTLSSEAENVYVTLLARDLRPEILVMARSITDQGEQRLLAAGANRVISPEKMGAHAMSQFVLRPSTMEFVELATGKEHLELQLDEVRLSPGSPLVGKTIAECGIRRRWGLIVVGVVRSGDKMVFNPSPDQMIAAESKLILLGRREDLDEFSRTS